jgi:hypothetical protein
LNQPTWSGFDPRKVCPQCGGYQTRVWKYDRSRAPSQKPIAFLLLTMLALLLLSIYLVVLPLARGVFPRPAQLISLLFIALVGLGNVLFNANLKEVLRGLDGSLQRYFSGVKEEPVEPGQLTGYGLECGECGCRWMKTSAEWELEVQKEAEELRERPPSPTVENREALVGGEGRIEWKPPDRTRGFLIVVAAVILLLVTGALAIGVLVLLPR